MGRRPVAHLALLVLVLVVGALAAPAHGAGRHVLGPAGGRLTYRVVGAGRILVAARSTPCRHVATLRLRVDGRLDRTIRLRAHGRRVYRSSRRYAAGRHNVTLVRRPSTSGRCNRRVTIRRVTIGRPGHLPPKTGPTTPSGPSFTLAVIGDTQKEVFPGDTSFGARTSWLVAHRSALNLDFVAQTGDLVNWGWLEPSQYDVATAAMSKLTAAGIPWQAAVGNHDTAAVGWNGIPGSSDYGGSAYQENPECPAHLGAQLCDSRLLVRNTDAFNAHIKAADEGAVAGTFQGKLENSYSTFSAAGRTWLVLSIELWPRQAALTWASGVLAAHPHDNVIILTHDYLTGRRSLAGNGGYGSLTAVDIYNQLVVPHDNVKLVFSGHEGLTAERVDRPHGHQVASFLGNETAGVGVTRLVHIYPDSGVVSTRWWSGTVDLDSTPTGTTSDGGFAFK